MPSEEELEIALGPASVKAKGQSLSKLGDAVADLLSPFSQGFGLIGDHIRILRERSVSAVLERATELAAERGQAIEPVNPKNLVPLLENASMDDPTDGVVDLWARLLLSGDETFDAEMAQLSDSLKRIGRKEADFLKSMCTGSSTFPLELSTDSLNRHNETLVRRLAGGITYRDGEALLEQKIRSFHDKIGLHYGRIYEAWLAPVNGEENISFYNLGRETAEILSREHLMRVVHVEDDRSEDSYVFTFCDVTRWGVRLIRRCYPELVAEAEARRRNAG